MATPLAFSVLTWGRCLSVVAHSVVRHWHRSGGGSPAVLDLAGEYRATVFCAVEADTPRDLLAEGGLLDVILTDDRTTAGRVFVPGGDEGGGDFDANLVGALVLSNDTVTFEHDADTFVRDMPFTFRDGTLRGDRMFAGVALRVVLSKN